MYSNIAFPQHTGISIYTNGSELNKQVTGGVFSAKLDTKITFRLPDHCSVFHLEITVIKESAFVLTKSALTTRNVFIYTDSQTALKSLNYFRVSSKLVKECLDLLVDLTSINVQ